MLEEQQENFVEVVAKWEGHQGKVKMSRSEKKKGMRTRTTFPP